jgi:NAD(P)-dependent dehydrogenase (short-subunit alcohol dehydrogenase family)
MTSIRSLQNLRGRRVILTGAAGRLGLVMAQTLAELGADLILVDMPDTDFSEIEKELFDRWGVNVESYGCDLELEDERAHLGDTVKSNYQSLNCLINNAAFVGSKDLSGWAEPFEDQSVSTWRRAFEVNLTSAFHLSQIFTPLLRAGTGGNILNITSIYGEYGPDWRMYEGSSMGNPAAYGTSKGGLAQLTRWLSTTLAPDIRVNAISPGGILRNQDEKFIERYEARTPMQRMATEDDFRGAVAFLTSDMSSYVTGQILRVDGGWGVW